MSTFKGENSNFSVSSLYVLLIFQGKCFDDSIYTSSFGQQTEVGVINQHGLG